MCTSHHQHKFLAEDLVCSSLSIRCWCATRTIWLQRSRVWEAICSWKSNKSASRWRFPTSCQVRCVWLWSTAEVLTTADVQRFTGTLWRERAGSSDIGRPWTEKVLAEGKLLPLWSPRWQAQLYCCHHFIHRQTQALPSALYSLFLLLKRSESHITHTIMWNNNAAHTWVEFHNV